MRFFRSAVVLCGCLIGRFVAAQPLELTDDEKAWLAAHPVIRVALPSGGPFAIAGHDGAAAGLSIDYLQFIASKTGARFENHLVISVQEAIDGVRSQTFDAVMGIGHTSEREAVLLFGSPYTYSPDAIVTRTDSPFLFDVRELAGTRVALARSSRAIAESLRARVRDAVIVEYESMPEAVLAVSRGEVFAAVTDASIAAFTVKQRRLNNVRVSGIFNAPADVYLAVRRDWGPLVSIVDKALAAMPDAERAQITNRWMVLDYASDRRWERAFGWLVVFLIVTFLVIAVLGHYIRKAHTAQTQLEKISTEKSELLRMVAHDLRNPLTSLLLNIQLISAKPAALDDEMLADLRASIGSMQSLISLLVDQQAIEAGHRTWQWVRLEPGDETEAAIRSVTEAAKRKGINVVVEREPVLPAFESDRSAFRQVIDNLVTNAVKYSPTGSLVRVEVKRRVDAVQIAVRDQGPGVPPAERESIFTKYGTGSAHPTGGETSTGLGLWIVASIVAQLKGRVWCEGEPGEGATFVLEFPIHMTPTARATSSR